MRPRLDMLDGLRGMAAVIVLILHIANHNGDYSFPLAGLSADFFFLLSGFIVAYSYEHELNAGMSGWNYIAIRLIRLYPLALAGMAMGLLMTLGRVVLVGDVTALGFVSVAVSSILLLPSYALPQYEWSFPANFTLWFLFFEIIASMTYLAIARRSGIVRPLMIVIIAGAAMIWTACSHGMFLYGADKELFYAGFFHSFFSFYFGVLLCRIRTPIVKYGNAHAVLLSAIFCLALLFPLGNPISVQIFMVMLLFPAILLSALAIHVGGALARAFRYLGVIAYPLYVVHAPILRAFLELQRRIPGLAAKPAVVIALEALASVCVAVIAYRFYDVPVRRFLRRRLATATGRPAAETAAG